MIPRISLGYMLLTYNSVPVGLEDVSKYLALFAELLKRGYSDSDVEKIARQNLIRVFMAVEKVCTLSPSHS